jgi:DNA mismatch endonuclease (patch repair protein)
MNEAAFWQGQCPKLHSSVALHSGRNRILPMADVFTKAKRSQIMAAVRSTGNKDTELRLMKLFRQQGITGWRRHQPVLGRPVFVFQRERVAVFVDGCFWHGCPRHCQIPQNNRKYWQAKITRNAIRDHYNTRHLRVAGWKVVRIWSHSLDVPEKVIAKITSVLSQQLVLCNHQRK